MLKRAAVVLSLVVALVACGQGKLAEGAAPGVAGLPGAQGPEGPVGADGPAGAVGPEGAQGPEGPQGPRGPQGIAGVQGLDGLPGLDGVDGAVGPQGPAGQPGGAILQVAYADSAAVVTGTAPIPFDDSIPQQFEGSEFLTVSITPRSATSSLLVELSACFSESENHSNQLIGALFRDIDGDALVAGWGNLTFHNSGYGGANNYTDGPFLLRVRVPAGSTAPTTFKFRAGGDGGPVVMNGLGNATKLGGSVRTALTVSEIAGP